VSKVILNLGEKQLPCQVSLKDGLIQLAWENTQGNPKQTHFKIHLKGQGEGILSHQHSLEEAGAIVPFYYHLDCPHVHVWVQGQSYVFEKASLLPQRGNGSGAGGQGAGSGEVKSPMPGTILKIMVTPGQVVEAAQVLLIMESMKMEMTLTAPYAGVVDSVFCEAAQLVEMGSVLVKMAPPAVVAP
jgi:biotin carboxyl carrier protein